VRCKYNGNQSHVQLTIGAIEMPAQLPFVKKLFGSLMNALHCVVAPLHPIIVIVIVIIKKIGSPWI